MGMNFEPIYSSERVNLLIHVFEPLRVWLNEGAMYFAGDPAPLRIRDRFLSCYKRGCG